MLRSIECMLRLQFAIAFGPMGRAVGKAMALACTGSCTAPVLGPVLVLGSCTGAVLALVHFKHAVLYWLYWHPLVENRLNVNIGIDSTCIYPYRKVVLDFYPG